MKAAVAVDHERLDHVSVSHRSLDQLASAIRGELLKVCQAASAEVIDDDDLVPSGNERIGQMRADEPGATSDQVPQSLVPPPIKPCAAALELRARRRRPTFSSNGVLTHWSNGFHVDRQVPLGTPPCENWIPSRPRSGGPRENAIAAPGLPQGHAWKAHRSVARIAQEVDRPPSSHLHN